MAEFLLLVSLYQCKATLAFENLHINNILWYSPNEKKEKTVAPVSNSGRQLSSKLSPLQNPYIYESLINVAVPLCLHSVCYNLEFSWKYDCRTHCGSAIMDPTRSENIDYYLHSGS